jgi:hypothetical protein
MNTVMAWGDNKELCNLAEEVVAFCVQELMPRMRTLDICIEVSDETDVCGYCMAVDKREFVIEVKEDLDKLEFISTLCHEMVHVKQYARGELDIDGKMSYKTHEEYMNLWYEKEAYEQEVVLTKKYIANES